VLNIKKKKPYMDFLKITGRSTVVHAMSNTFAADLEMFLVIVHSLLGVHFLSLSGVILL